MSLFHKTNNWQAKIAKTGFLTSLISYIIFWLINAIRPGFVARYFSIHIFLLLCIIFGVWWRVSMKEYADRPIIQYLVSFLFGILFAVVTWKLGSGFQEYRLLIVLISFISPVLFLSLLRSK